MQEAVASSSHHRDERRSVLIISAPTVQWTVAAANEAEREAWLQALHDASGGAQSSCVSYDLEPDMCAASRLVTAYNRIDSAAQRSIADCTSDHSLSLATPAVRRRSRGFIWCAALCRVVLRAHALKEMRCLEPSQAKAP